MKNKHILKPFGIVLLSLLFVTTGNNLIAQKKNEPNKTRITQKTEGDQSPAIHAKGNVTIHYKGVSKEQYDYLLRELDNKQKLVDRLFQMLDERKVTIANRDQTIKDWVQKYKELRQRLDQRSGQSQLVAQAKEKLQNGDFEGAEKLLLQSMEQHLKNMKKEQKAAAADAFELGSLKKLQLKYSEARNFYQQAAQLDSKNSLYLNEFGFLLHTLGEHKKAIDYYERALSIDKEFYGERHPQIAIYLNNLGGAWDSLGEYKKAIDYYERALSIGKEVYGERHPKIALRLNNLGGAWNSLGEYKKAIDYYERALSIDKEVYGERHPDVAIDLNNLGSAWNSLGEYKKAIDYYERALSIDKEFYGERHPQVAIYLNNLGSAWYSLKEYKKAASYFEKAEAIFLKTFGADHPHTKVVRGWLASTKKRL